MIAFGRKRALVRVRLWPIAVARGRGATVLVGHRGQTMFSKCGLSLKSDLLLGIYDHSPQSLSRLYIDQIMRFIYQHLPHKLETEDMFHVHKAKKPRLNNGPTHHILN